MEKGERVNGRIKEQITSSTDEKEALRKIKKIHKKIKKIHKKLQILQK